MIHGCNNYSLIHTWKINYKHHYVWRYIRAIENEYDRRYLSHRHWHRIYVFRGVKSRFRRGLSCTILNAAILPSNVGNSVYRYQYSHPYPFLLHACTSSDRVMKWGAQVYTFTSARVPYRAPFDLTRWQRSCR